MGMLNSVVRRGRLMQDGIAISIVLKIKKLCSASKSGNTAGGSGHSVKTASLCVGRSVVGRSLAFAECLQLHEFVIVAPLQQQLVVCAALAHFTLLDEVTVVASVPYTHGEIHK